SSDLASRKTGRVVEKGSDVVGDSRVSASHAVGPGAKPLGGRRRRRQGQAHNERGHWMKQLVHLHPNPSACPPIGAAPDSCPREDASLILRLYQLVLSQESSNLGDIWSCYVPLMDALDRDDALGVDDASVPDHLASFVQRDPSDLVDTLALVQRLLARGEFLREKQVEVFGAVTGRDVKGEQVRKLFRPVARLFGQFPRGADRRVFAGL